MSIERILETEMRFYALEYMVSHLYVTIFRAYGADRAKIDASQAELLARASTHTFPVGDPALADVSAAAFEEALRHLVNLQREMLGFPKM